MGFCEKLFLLCDKEWVYAFGFCVGFDCRDFIYFEISRSSLDNCPLGLAGFCLYGDVDIRYFLSEYDNWRITNLLCLFADAQVYPKIWRAAGFGWGWVCLVL